MIDRLLPYAFIFVAYILGSVPFGVLVSRSKGIDIQKVGSGNIGATNVLRTLGKLPALITLLGDTLKGVAAIVMIRLFAGGEVIEGIAGVAVVFGHMYSIFLSFRGGKGVATGFGVFAVYSPVSALVSITVWILTAFFLRYSSLAAITAFFSLPVVLAVSGASGVKIYFAIVIAFLIILRHKKNIQRLVNGQETRIGEKRN
ncbi:MAG: glycerol-3-phosphate 1-O-acyltransferase PlsY [Nitrospiraceae bacterium]|nr:MAG: glycerol-3-phosphate 1-O-acyltransferase PlsY [Nitrospiraceae bacterium]